MIDTDLKTEFNESSIMTITLLFVEVVEVAFKGSKRVVHVVLLLPPS